jgi:hypothetical protein
MTPKFTFLKASFFGLLLFSFLSASAEIYPVYLTEGGTVTLALKTPLNPGEKAVWAENGTPLASAADGSYTIPAGQTVGIHTYSVHLVSPDPTLCNGDVLEYKVYVLPQTTITLSDASTPLYCENAGTTSTFTATAQVSPALPEGVSYTYLWEGTKDGSSVTDVSSWGQYSTAADAMSSTFSFNNITVGKYELIAKLNYVVPAGSILRSSDGKGDIRTSSPKPVEVAPKPITPSIIVM